MLPAALRLALRSYPEFFKTSRRAHHSHLTVYWKKARPVGASVVVAKKQFPLAVDRNRLKRKIHQALFSTQSSWQGYQSVIIPKLSAQKLTIGELSHSLQEIFSKIKTY